ncbi:isocitrate lyase [Kwoniella shandongensis]|uniref:Isocitrate lyase n=1 Tax=Kwoniella shandongensis TaxID=1734106 RepID=A0AAJ8MYZ7_9TREE
MSDLEQIGELTQFFQSSEQAHFARSWTVDDVERLRNPGPTEEYPLSNRQARKLRKALDSNSRNGSTSFTYGAADPIMAHEMGEAGFDTLYVSGANATLADVPTFDCGGDLADYTYDTLPRKVKQLVQNQLHWARVDKVRTHIGNLKGSKKGIDRLVPIIADGDSGHGNSTATMKMVKLFLDAGVAAIHLDDLLSGEKNFSAGSLTHVVVPVSEHIRRLSAAKLQLDICGSHVVLVGRTDSESASRITSTIDARDRPFILGRTNVDIPSLNQFLQGSKTTGVSRLQEEGEWELQAYLKTLDEAVKGSCTPDEFKEWTSKSVNLNVSDALLLATKMNMSVIWDAEGCRNERGWYRYNGGIEAAISRSIAYAAHSDMVWSCAPGYKRDSVVRYEKEVHRAVPGKWLGYNWSFGDFSKDTDDNIAKLVRDVGSLGYVWQFNPQAGFYAQGIAMHDFAKAVYKDHMVPYVRSIQDGEKKEVSVIDWYEEAGDLVDYMTDIVSLNP